MEKAILRYLFFQNTSPVSTMRTCACKVNSRLFSKAKKPTNAAETPVYSKNTEEYAFGKRFTVKNLEQLLSVKKITALDIANKYKKLSLVNGKKMATNFTLCKEAGLTKETLLKYPEILAQTNLDYKLSLVKQLSFDMNVVAPLLNVETKNLKGFIESFASEREVYGKGGRIGYLSELLQFSVEEVCEILYKKAFLRTINLERIMKTMELLLG